MDMADQLTQAAEGGDAILVARLLGAGAVVDAPNRAWRTALDLAVQKGHADVVRLLLTAGADPAQCAGEYGELTPLCQAAMHGHAAVADILLDAGVHTQAQGRMGYLPLVLAATAGYPPRGHPETVAVLLDHGADINGVMKDKTPLEWAVQFGQVQMVHQLLDRGAKPTAMALTRAHEYAKRSLDSRHKYEPIIEALRAADARTGWTTGHQSSVANGQNSMSADSDAVH
ncbi:ankyrin repeat protein [Streptomyces griseoflavus Tu4000]|uniref:Ankyrin repeat protein n=2 Tax=Streptomyces griseoflavus TaxID=35619 RepID=D9XMT7_9ACTN|nr:ankyrin repeat protein [Streptomyces griseoflavus Tu4000]